MVTAVGWPQTAGAQVAELLPKPDPVTTNASVPVVAAATCDGKIEVTTAFGSPTVMVMATTMVVPAPYVIVTVPVSDAPTLAFIRTSFRKLMVIGVPKL